MNKRVIKTVVKRFKYFDKHLDYTKEAVPVLKLVELSIQDPDFVFTKEMEKARRRFEKEALVASRLFNVMLINIQPTTLNMLENPSQKTTKQQVLSIVSSQSNLDKELVTIGEYNYYPMTKDEYDLYNEIISEINAEL